jgi:heme A synthase
MRKSTLYGTAIVVVAVALGSAVFATDAVAAGGNAYISSEPTPRQPKG